MQLSLRIAPSRQWSVDGLVFLLTEGREALPPALDAWLHSHTAGLPDTAVADFRAEAGQVSVLYPAHGPRLLLAGLGKTGEVKGDQLRLASAAVARKARDLRLASLGLPLGPASLLEGLPLEASGLSLAQALEELLLAAALGLYDFKARTAPNAETPPLPELVLLSETPLAPELAQAVSLAQAQSQGLELARDLVNRPANQATPDMLAITARELAARHGFQAQVLEREALAALGMGAFLAVDQAGGEPSRFLILDTAPEDGAQPLVFVGKGVTFDTGGICLKPSLGMEKMKGDMAGAAAILGLFETLGALGQAGRQRRVVALLPCSENMPGARAVKPGDVATTAAGKTVEIINTDAEGRLLLCDALAYAGRYQPALLVDIATLTGACVVALGAGLGAIFTDQAELAQALRDVSARLGEPFWPMPLWGPYAEVLKSEVADVKNVGPREGGAIHAALFLQKFVPQGVPWVHLDIAGPGWSDKASGPLAVGGTGFGLRTLLALVLRPQLTATLTAAS